MQTINQDHQESESLDPRDHRVMGRELGLFTFSDVVGKGLPLWTAKGATFRRELEHFVVDTELKWGYQHVYTPDIGKIDLYKKSGHYPYYKETMYAPIKIDDEEYMLRPMTCPHHFELFLSQPRSYKELPMRIAEIAKLYRYELSGVLSGLTRVRSFCLADSHIICANKAQAKEEIKGALNLIDFVAKTFGLKPGSNYRYRLSLGDRKNTTKYVDDPQGWDDAEDLLRHSLVERNADYFEAADEAAFYGPKIDIQMKKITGVEETAFTVQYDFVMPERFNLKFIGADGLEQMAIVIHRSSIGAIERVAAFLLEHFAGSLPTWLSPVQVALLPISDKILPYAKQVDESLKSLNIRTELDQSAETLGKKIHNSQAQKIPYMLILGEKEQSQNIVSVRSRNQPDLGQMTLQAFIAKIKIEIDQKLL